MRCSVEAMIQDEDQDDEQVEEQQEGEDWVISSPSSSCDKNEDSAAEEDNEEDVENEAEGEEGSPLGKRHAASNYGYGSRKKIASLVPSEAEEEGGVMSSRQSPHCISHKNSTMTAKELPSVDGEPISLTPWITQALVWIRNAHNHITRSQELLGHPSSAYFVELRKIRSATLNLLTCTDDAISHAHTTQARLEKIALKQELATAQNELKKWQSQYTSQVSLLKEARSEMEEQKAYFQWKNATLQLSHEAQKAALLEKQRVLERQLEDEKDKSICLVCHEKPRDTVILPCLHFQFCFVCLLRHREVNSNTCPSCRGPILGLNMSLVSAGQ